VNQVYRICDVVRAASKLVIVVGPSQLDPNIRTPDDMLAQWGERLWTFPEVLLSPAGKPISVYMRGNEVAPFDISKAHFAAKAWHDSDKSKQLVDHFEGTLTLSRLELVTLAMECLQGRRTSQRHRGDQSYALMGMLRLRKSDPTDSAFQAFARLSLLNDSDQLLERLVCMLPTERSISWATMTDQYGARLWDIEPNIQISGIGNSDTVIIDGARGANVRWESFARVYNERHKSLLRMGAQTLLHTSGMVFYLAATLLVALKPQASSGPDIPGVPKSGGSASSNPAQIFAIVLLIYAFILVFMSPWLLRVLYGGKFWKTQAWLFAFEGYMSIEDIEKKLFGARLGRLKWSKFGSPLSRHIANKQDECVGIDPTTDPRVRDVVQRSRNAPYGEPRVCDLYHR
jgi:hypothetical protein